MRICLIIFFFLFLNDVASSQKFEFEDKNVFFQFHISQLNDSTIIENIQIKNTTDSSIFIPNIKRTDIYYFFLGNSLYSYCGAIKSLLGQVNAELKVFLIEIKKGDTFQKDVPISIKGTIFKYYFSFDYLKENTLKTLSYESAEEGLMVGFSDYWEKCHSEYKEVKK